MMRTWGGLFVLLLMASVAMGQGVPESKKEAGERYRWVYADTSGVTSAVTIRFPRNNIRNDCAACTTNAIPTDTALMETTALGPNTVWWIQLAQFTENVDLAWYIWSNCFPAGVDTVYTNQNIPFLTFGGCPIDSVVCAGDASGPDIQVTASDGK
jgi:hypothetical protein